MNNIVRRVLRFVVRVAQWCVAAFLFVICIILAFTASEFQKKGIDASIYFFAIAGMAVVAVGLLPPLFFRLPIRGRLGAYALVLMAFAAVLWSFSTVNGAYQRTPKGAAEAASQTERARQEADLKASTAVFEEHERYLADTRSKVQRCINWQGQVPALVQAVKGSLHNPRSFEHVGTEVKIVGDTGVPAVVMEYRGENGFGAIRTETVSAFIAPEDCSVRAMKEYESSDFD